MVSGASPFFVHVTPDGSSAYVPNFGDGTVSQYDIDAAAS